MKTNKSDDWSTPPDLIKVLDAEFHFDTEICAAANNRVLPNLPYAGLDNNLDALNTTWRYIYPYVKVGAVHFCNPPYSKLKEFVKKAAEQADLGDTVVLLIPAYLGTKYFYDVIKPKASEVRILRKRLTFWENGKPGPYPARFDSCIVVFRPHKPAGADAHIWLWDWKKQL